MKEMIDDLWNYDKNLKLVKKEIYELLLNRWLPEPRNEEEDKWIREQMKEHDFSWAKLGFYRDMERKYEYKISELKAMIILEDKENKSQSLNELMVIAFKFEAYDEMNDEELQKRKRIFDIYIEENSEIIDNLEGGVFCPNHQG